MAENTLALLQFLSSDQSPLPTLTAGYARPSTVYFTLFGKFYMYSFRTARIMYLALFAVSLTFVRISSSSRIHKERASWIRGLVAVMASTFGTIIVPNLVALVMSKGMNKGMSWFSSPFSPIALYAPPTLLGALMSQYLVGPVFERDILNALLILQSGLACGIQMAGIGSAGLFFLSSLPLFMALLLNPLITGNVTDISLITYAIAQLVPLLIGSPMLATVSEVFVPLVSLAGVLPQGPLKSMAFRLVESGHKPLQTILWQQLWHFWVLKHFLSLCPLLIGLGTGNYGMQSSCQPPRQ